MDGHRSVPEREPMNDVVFKNIIFMLTSSANEKKPCDLAISWDMWFKILEKLSGVICHLKVLFMKSTIGAAYICPELEAQLTMEFDRYKSAQTKIEWYLQDAINKYKQEQTRNEGPAKFYTKRKAARTNLVL